MARAARLGPAEFQNQRVRHLGHSAPTPFSKERPRSADLANRAAMC
jgi:hypothetical protein